MRAWQPKDLKGRGWRSAWERRERERERKAHTRGRGRERERERVRFGSSF